MLPASAGSSSLVIFFYGWMVWRSWGAPVTSHLGPIHGIGELLDYFLRRSFTDVDASPSADWSDRFQFLYWFFSENARAYSLFGSALIIVGIWRFLKIDRGLGWGLIVLWFSQGVLLILQLNFDFEGHRIGTIRVYSLVCYGVLAIWLVAGLFEIGGQVQRYFSNAILSRFVPTFFLILSMPIFVWVGLRSYTVNDTSNFYYSRDFASYFLNRLPPNAIFLIEGDAATGVLGYHQLVEILRPDVDMYQLQGIIFASSLYPSSLAQAEKRKLLQDLISSSQRPVYFFSENSATSWCPNCQISREGMLARVSMGDGSNPSHWTYADQAYVNQLIETDFTNSWVASERAYLLFDFGYSAAKFPLLSLEARQEFDSAILHEAAAPWAPLGALTSMFQGETAPQAEQWLEAVARTKEQLKIRREYEALYLTVQGLWALRQGFSHSALEFLEQSIALWDHPSNVAYAITQQIRKDEDARSDCQ